MGRGGVAPPTLAEIGASMGPTVPAGLIGANFGFQGGSVGGPSNGATNFGNPFGSSSFMDTTGRDLGMRANEIVPNALIVAPDLNDPKTTGQTQVLGPGMLLFARRQNPAPDSYERQIAPFKQSPYIVNSTNTTHMLEWTQLAEFLARNTGRYHDARQVLDEWHFAGGLKNEVTPNTTSNYGKRPHTRLVNLVIRGPFSAFNVWGRKVSPAQSLYFIIKKGPVDSCFVQQAAKGNVKAGTATFDFMHYWQTSSGGKDDLVHVAKKAKRDGSPDQEQLVAKIRAHAWKIVPWTSPDASVPAYEDVAYMDVDEHGSVVQRAGDYIKVGHAFYTDGLPAVSGGPRSNGDFADTIALFNRGLLSNIEICLGV
jgi:hypothetical protein